MGENRESLDPHRRYLKVLAFFVIAGLLQKWPQILPDKLEHLRERFRYVSSPAAITGGRSSYRDPVASVSWLELKVIEWDGKWMGVSGRSFKVYGVAWTFQVSH